MPFLFPGLKELVTQTAARNNVLEIFLESPLRRRLENVPAPGFRGPVFLVPGIFGSELARRRLLGHHVIWFNPAALDQGEIGHLALRPSSPELEPRAPIPFAYLILSVWLKLAGYRVEFLPFDWRRDINQLGAELAGKLETAPQSQIDLVTHSMGSLLVRAALRNPGVNRKIRRVIMLGPPNRGAFIPAQAIRGTSIFVRLLANLLAESPGAIAAVLRTFPGLIQMMPPEMHDPAIWPAETRPDPEILNRAKEVLPNLPGIDDRFVIISGMQQETIVGVRRVDGEFEYDLSPDGDGQVPLDSVELEPAPVFYVRENHPLLAANPEVAGAVVDLLQDGATTRLESRPPTRRGITQTVRDSGLTNLESDLREATGLTLQQARNLLPLWTPSPLAAVFGR